MTVRAIGILLLKVWGLTSLAAGFIGVANMAILLGSAQSASEPAMQRYMLMTNGLSAVASLVLGTVLLLGARRIVGLVASEEEAPQSPAPDRYSLADLQSLVFGGLGVFFAIAAFRNIAELVYAIVRQPAWDGSGQLEYLIASHQQQLVGAVVQLVFAIVLLFSRSALASAWSRIHPMTAESQEPAR